jgi:hypothetical protein
MLSLAKLKSGMDVVSHDFLAIPFRMRTAASIIYLLKSLLKAIAQVKT